MAHHDWKEFHYKNYSAIAVWFPEDDERRGEWVGEFNYPIRRFVHSFVGKTVEEAQSQFERGVDSYFSKISMIPSLQPEAEGLAGVAELIEMERRGRDYEFSLLIWPPKIKADFVLISNDLITMSCSSISFNQAALDELNILLEASPMMTIKEFRNWAERVWRNGELERTAAGMSISKAREVSHA